MKTSFSKEKDAVAGAMARVDLLPIEVKRRKGQKQTRGILVMAVVAVAVLAVGATVVANIGAFEATSRLDAANQRTIELTKLEAKYAEVPTVLGQIATTEDGVIKATAVEVQWRAFLTEVTSSLPAGYIVTNLTATGFNVTTVPQIDPAQLAATDVVTVNFTATGSSLPVVADWLTALQGVTGYSEGWINNVKVDEGVYTVDATLTVNGKAISSPQRSYMPKAEEK